VFEREIRPRGLDGALPDAEREISWGSEGAFEGAVSGAGVGQLEKHGALWGFVNTLAKESGDKDFVRFFYVANNLHKNFYANEMPEETIEISAEDVEKLITKLKEVK